MSESFLESGERTSPPRQNGELAFAAPWESRVFGVAAALRERGVFDWDEFRVALIAEISDWESQGHPAAEWSYYARFQAALERLLAQKRLCSAAELDSREREFAERPEGHDHSVEPTRHDP